MKTAPASNILALDDPAELDFVRLLEPVETERGVLPRGAEGTVVLVWEEGPAYCIEFTEPFQALADVRRSQIAVIWTP